jgi:phosphoribosyl-AMP cyclohydrolase
MNVSDLKYDERGLITDTLLVRVAQRGPGACHTGERTCFFRKLDKGSL